METSGVGRILLIVGVIALVAGGIFLLLGKMGLGSMPGDMQWGKGNVRFYFPLGTSIVLSIILTVLLNLFLRR
ncbi:MAG TPA: DUF2905 domain-containing protein [Actinomycetota bacterium]|jgi:hypothetical protein|nr:DUF2905 domain-containing protein [Actinomycetota bacterium]